MRETDLYTAKPLVAVTRGAVTECVHSGHVAIVDADGSLCCSLGNPEATTFMRSAAKPAQTIPVILSGAAVRFQFTDAELAVMCGSHYAEPYHLDAVKAILEKIRLGNQHLKCGPATSLNPDLAWKMAWNHREKEPIYNDCSGKHAGMLAVCVQNGWPILGYTHPEHPMQREIHRMTAALCGLMMDEIEIGVDGCAAPVFAMPLSAMARAFAHLANPDTVDEPIRSALVRIRDAMWAHPEMLAGTGGFCTALNGGGRGQVVGKLGAEGIYCMGITGQNRGIALKVNDGAFRGVWPSAVAVLDQLNAVDETLESTISEFREMPNRNDLGDTVGSIRSVFTLTAVTG